jgi:hypothetical protein
MKPHSRSGHETSLAERAWHLTRGAGMTATNGVRMTKTQAETA